jgi:two-component system, NarL family, response regulator NreC
MAITVLIADDHQLIRQGLRALLEKEGFNVVGEAANGQEALSLTIELHPDVAILDIAMPIMNGIDAAREIQHASGKTKTVLLSMHTACQYILNGLRAGAKGFILKTHAAEDLVRGVRKAAHGEIYLSPEISEAVLQAYRNKSDIPEDPLSTRERQVLQLIADGKSTKEAASALKITTKTAETYRTRIMEKLEIHNTASLVHYAVRRGLVQP